MTRTIRLTAFLTANQFDIRGIKAFLDIKPQADSSSELFYKFSDDKYQQFFNYGVVVFTGYTEEEMKWSIKTVTPHQRGALNQWMRDEFQIRLDEGTGTVFEFNGAVLGLINDRVIRIAMLNLAQSLALDQYRNITETLLTEATTFTSQLEKTGKLRVRRKVLMRFLGRALNTQNAIAENIYVFDAPDLVWDDEYLDKLHQGLIRHFDLRVRFSEVEYMLKIIEGNLRVFSEINHQRESNTLEWIIIILILVEVFDLLMSKLLY